MRDSITPVSRCKPSATKLNLFKREWQGHDFADLISSVIASQAEGLQEEEEEEEEEEKIQRGAGEERLGRWGGRGRGGGRGGAGGKKEFLNSFIPRGSHFKRTPDRNFRFKPALPLSLFLFL